MRVVTTHLPFTSGTRLRLARPATQQHSRRCRIISKFSSETPHVQSLSTSSSLVPVAQRSVVPATPLLAAAVAASLLVAGPALAADHLNGFAELQELAEAYIPGVVGDSPFREGVVSGFLLILFSEIGDKTFFIAVLLALKQSRAAVFAGTFGALAVMTVISVGLGQVFHRIDELLPQSGIPLDDVLAVILLVFFGVKTLKDAASAEEDAAGEKEEAEEAVAGMSGDATGLILSTFALVFAAEWGDKSFLATIALAAASSPLGVTLGAIGGHGVATGMAVAGGSVLSKYVDEKILQYVGGSLFLVFAASTVVDLIGETHL